MREELDRLYDVPYDFVKEEMVRLLPFKIYTQAYCSICRRKELQFLLSLRNTYLRNKGKNRN